MGLRPRCLLIVLALGWSTGAAWSEVGDADRQPPVLTDEATRESSGVDLAATVDTTLPRSEQLGRAFCKTVSSESCRALMEYYCAGRVPLPGSTIPGTPNFLIIRNCPSAYQGPAAPCCSWQCSDGFMQRRECGHPSSSGVPLPSPIDPDAIDVSSLKGVLCPRLASASPPVPISRCEQADIRLDPDVPSACSDRFGLTIRLPVPDRGQVRERWHRTMAAQLYHEFRERAWRKDDPGSQGSANGTAHARALLDELANARHFELYYDMSYILGIGARLDIRPTDPEVREEVERRVQEWIRLELLR